MLVAFPATSEVVILLVGRHDRNDPSVDVYSRLYATLGIEVPSDERRKPDCCSDGEPPVSPEIADEFIARTRELFRHERRRRRAS